MVPQDPTSEAFASITHRKYASQARTGTVHGLSVVLAGSVHRETLAE